MTHEELVGHLPPVLKFEARNSCKLGWTHGRIWLLILAVVLITEFISGNDRVFQYLEAFTSWSFAGQLFPAVAFGNILQNVYE